MADAPPPKVGVLGLATRLGERSIREFFDDHCPQLAAAISYHVLFSVFPLAILLVAVFGLLPAGGAFRTTVVADVVSNVPLSASGSRRLTALLQGSSGGLGAVGFLGVIGLVWAASGMMGSIRLALTLAWDSERQRPYLQGKLIDVLLLFVLAALGLLSLGLVLASRLVASGALAPLARADWLFALAAPFALAFAALLFVYSVLPAVGTRLREVWPGALLAALVFVAVQNGFAFYLDHFSSYDRIYGSLATAIVFMLFVYVASSVFLFGAEVSSEWPRLRAELARGEGLEPGPPLWRQLVGVLRGLAVEDRDGSD